MSVKVSLSVNNLVTQLNVLRKYRSNSYNTVTTEIPQPPISQLLSSLDIK